MRRRAFLSGGVSAAAVAITAPGIVRAQSPLTLRFAHYAAEDHPAHIAAKQFAAKIEERSQGAVKIAIFPNSVLGSPPELTQQIKLGLIDMGLPTEGQLDKYDKAFATVEVPFAFDDLAHVYRVLDGPAMQWWAPLAEKQGFILLAQWEYGFRNVTNNTRAINAPEDMKGLKIRTPPELQIQAAMEALGATVTAIAFPEVYLALSQGVVDGEENPVAVIYYSKFYEVQKHLALTRHVYNNMIHTVSGASWAKLSPAQQQIFREESAASGALMRKLIADQEADQLARMTASGIKLTRPDLAPFRARMAPALARVAAFAGEDNVKTFMAMVEKARQS
jgi:TRAP-type transport system periplasmic protein